MRATMAAAAVAMVLATGCGGDDGGDELGGLVPCAERYAEGATVTLDDLDAPCADSDGELVVVGRASWECVDGGRLVIAGDYGWGRVGEPTGEPDLGACLDE